MKVTVLYTLQCPSNLYFVRGIEEVAAAYKADVEVINVHEEYEKARAARAAGFSVDEDRGEALVVSIQIPR